MNNIQTRMICSAQIALITHVRPNLRVVYVNNTLPKLMQCHWYYDHKPDWEDHECATISDAEMWSDFPSLTPDLKIMVIPEPEPVVDAGCCVYARYETLGNHYKKPNIERVRELFTQDTIATTFCILQAMMLGRITPNLRRINLAYNYPNILEIVFYYDQEPSVLETQLREEFKTDFTLAYPADQFDTTLQTKVIPYPQLISNNNIRRTIYARYEEYDEDK